MLALALLGVLAAAGPGAPAGPDTSMRVPGTALRFGLADTLAAARGFAPAGPGRREGRCRFFGIDSDARLGFTDGRLARAEFMIEEASPHQRDYLQDQLSAMGYRRRCERLQPEASECEWTGRTVVRLTAAGARLQAVVTPPQPAGVTVPAGAAQPDSAGAPAGVAAPVAVPVLPDTLGVSPPGRPGRYAEAAVIETPGCTVRAGLGTSGSTGHVWVLALVDVDGHVLGATVTRSIPALDAAALDCLRRWRFEPRTWQGAPCRFRVEVPVTVSFD